MQLQLVGKFGANGHCEDFEVNFLKIIFVLICFGSSHVFSAKYLYVAVCLEPVICSDTPQNQKINSGQPKGPWGEKFTF